MINHYVGTTAVAGVGLVVVNAAAVVADVAGSGIGAAAVSAAAVAFVF